MFKGKSALITGGSRGIGLAIASRLAQEGANVTLVARNHASLEAATRSLPRDDRHNQHHHFQALNLLNLVNSNHPDALIAQKSLSSNTILVNCAGMTTHSLLHSTSQQQILDTLNLNLTIPILLSQWAIKNMIRNRKLHPAILNISSVLSLTDHVIPGTSVYAASKAGLLGFTTSLANEMKGRIRVNALMPGLVRETDMGSIVDEEKNVAPVVSLSFVADKAVEMLGDLSLNGECKMIEQ
ncbi:uncharacterized protein LODBEIA_P08610 [Lodderomyces beijingensis]|uniref:3-oxoacyl-[acyl-carrier-protein] reductase n=1 Tax=Lodderomyces beijingensis TaxID=1775926 RepID=A0ABP0ZGV6_9ASCO